MFWCATSLFFTFSDNMILKSTDNKLKQQSNLYDSLEINISIIGSLKLMNMIKKRYCLTSMIIQLADISSH